ncbi:hypothetical protein SAMN05660652_01039 [Propionivibrio dicarboxylicus]|uniref:Uncharacterized protein n=1 Tax=Propionivibrio dicarboxylicus TaxID=83767 RepID=A0A1G7Z127_9RHOO|nr:hypothetical protein SAMN05660652_01039 [Propionivibrio dicarboxylicus]
MREPRLRIIYASSKLPSSAIVSPCSSETLASVCCHRDSPLAPLRDRRSLPDQSAQPCRTRGRDTDALLHALAGRPDGDLRPPSGGLVRNDQPRRRTLRRRPEVRQCPAVRRRCAGRHDLSYRPRIRRRRTRRCRHLRELARRHLRSRFRHRILCRRVAADNALFTHVGRISVVDEPALRHSVRSWVLIHHASSATKKWFEFAKP